MREDMIVISPFEIIDLLEFRMYQQVNEHSRVEFTARIPAGAEDTYKKEAIQEMWAGVALLDEWGAEKKIFEGLVEELEIVRENGVSVLRCTLVTGTFLMDNVVHTRTFQNAAMTYTDVVNFYTTNYPKSAFITNPMLYVPIADWYLQYEETDWEFTKRMASQYQTVLVPECDKGGVKFFFGMPKRTEAIEVAPSRYETKRNMPEYHAKKKRGLAITEADAIYTIFEDREIYRLADCVLVDGQKLFIHQIESRIKGSELVHRYYLKTARGFEIPTIYNMSMIGASLAASIIDVCNDKIRVHVHADPEQDVATAKWFPFSTVYSTIDGTGWYAMPELGDEMRLYIGNKNERSGIVSSAVHLASSAPDERINPDHKSIMNKYKKEVLFTPDSITLTNNRGLTIKLDDHQGIKIHSIKKIEIVSSEAVTISSKNATLDVVAPSGISLTQGTTDLTIKDNIFYRGGQVKIQ